MAKRFERKRAVEIAEKIVSKMTIEEKISQLGFNAASIDRLDIPEYNYWNEALHGIANGGTATMFPQAIGLAAMFDDNLLNKIGDVISTEARAKYNENIKKGDRDIYKGLTFWSPNINIFRDPRWGRGQETYGEDPYLTGELGKAYVRGMQGDGEFLKTAACAKHFAVHSGPENVRHGFNAEVSMKDFHETYLSAFKTVIQEADVETLMTAYNSINGIPVAVNQDLLEMVREAWGFQGHVVSDFGALEDIKDSFKYTDSHAETIALTIKAGCDLCAGFLTQFLPEALRENKITEEEITRSVIRMMTTRVMLGMFSESTEYDSIPFEVNDSEEHHQVSLEATEKSFVLLKNDQMLPLDMSKIKTIGVIGPAADKVSVLHGNYFGTASNYTTLLRGIQNGFSNSARILYSEGCSLYGRSIKRLAKDNDRIAEAITVAEHSDIVVVCLGYDSTLEGEQGDPGNELPGGDRKDLRLPKLQQSLLEDVLKTGKPTILLTTSGGPLTFNGLEKNENLKAIIHLWYPGPHAGNAVANILLGKGSPSGKLPVTFYSEENTLPDSTDYSMKNRTYRYLTEEPMYPFGYGLSYSDYELLSIKVGDLDLASEEALKVEVNVKNNGKFHSEEVLQVYLKNKDSQHSPLNPCLVAFKRIDVACEEEKYFTLDIPKKSFMITDDEGSSRFDGKIYDIYVGFGQPDKRTESLLGKKCLQKQIHDLS